MYILAWVGEPPVTFADPATSTLQTSLQVKVALRNSRWLFSLLGVNERSEPTELIIHGSYWCGREDLNLHPLQDYHLKVARLPIPPRPLVFTGTSYMVSVFRIKLNTSLLAS